MDKCIFYCRTIYILNTNNSILAGLYQKEIDQVVRDVKRVKLNVTNEGDIQVFLGVNIESTKGWEHKFDSTTLG